jgi:hypothetical protein
MSYRVIKVSTRRELNDFINLPFQIYREDKNWVAPIKSELKRALNKNINPYFKFASLDLFNCYSDDKIIARIAISVNKNFCEKVGLKIAFFGFFESYNEPKAVKILFDEVFKFCKENQIVRIEGPFNPNLYSEVGMLSNKFDLPPVFFQTYNPEYYNTLLSENDFRILEVLHTRINYNSSEYLNKKFKEPLILQNGDLRVRGFNDEQTEIDLDHLRNIFNDAFSDNWHFTSVSKEEYLFSSKHLKLVTPPELIQFVEYKGKPVAAVHFVLDINPLLKQFNGKGSIINYIKLLVGHKKIKRISIFAVGIKKEFRNSKVTQLLFNATVEIAKKFEILETTWMYDENKTIISIANRLNLIRDKEFNTYFRELAG